MVSKSKESPSKQSILKYLKRYVPPVVLVLLTGLGIVYLRKYYFQIKKKIETDDERLAFSRLKQAQANGYSSWKEYVDGENKKYL
jgi:hypothetical protein